MVLLIAGVGADGVRTARNIDALVTALHEQHALPALGLKDATVNFLRISRAVRNAILDSDSAAVLKRASDITRYDASFVESFAKYESKIVHREQRDQAARLRSAYVRLRTQQDAVVTLALARDDVAVVGHLSVIRAQADYIEALIYTLTSKKLELMQAASDESSASYPAATRAMLVLIVCVLLFAVVAAVGITRPVVQSLTQLREVADALALGDLSASVQISAKDELGRLGESMTRMIRARKSLARSAGEISAGDMTTTVSVPGERDAVGHAFVQLQQTMRALVSKTGGLVAAATAGQLTVRGESSQCTGAYRDLVTGMNDTLDGFVTPMNDETARIVRMYAVFTVVEQVAAAPALAPSALQAVASRFMVSMPSPRG